MTQLKHIHKTKGCVQYTFLTKTLWLMHKQPTPINSHCVSQEQDDSEDSLNPSSHQITKKEEKDRTKSSATHLLGPPEAWNTCLFPCRPGCTSHSTASCYWTGHPGNLRKEIGNLEYVIAKSIYQCCSYWVATYSLWNKHMLLCIWVQSWSL